MSQNCFTGVTLTSRRRGEEKTAEILTEDPIDSRIAVHDSHHFEVKLDYSIDSKKRKNRYQVESYFFIPRSLGINRETYPREQFYSDVQAYIRFKTPTIALRTLADTDEALSPLNHIRRLLDLLSRDPRDREAERRLSHELRMFGCEARARLRDQTDVLKDRLSELSGKADRREVLVQDLRRNWELFLENVGEAMHSWRSLRPEFTSGSLPRSTQETYQFVDEYVSLVLENKLTSLLRALDGGSDLAGPLAGLRKDTREKLLAERRYREGAGYQAVVRDDDAHQNEHYVYRRGMLKKFVMSILWLEIAKEKQGSGAANIGAAIAAGTAMAFALLATILHTQWWMINTSGFVVAMTITYILKDRIKEWLKHFFAARFARFLADYSEKIQDPSTERELGRCRETFSWISEASVPREVLALRHRGAAASIEAQAKPEVIIRYQKDVRLNGSAIVERLHLEDYDLNDIIRFGISQFLMRADDPVAYVSTFAEGSDRVEKRPFPKVYHLNVVLVLRASAAPKSSVLKRIRVVFDKGGIRRLEEIH